MVKRKRPRVSTGAFSYSFLRLVVRYGRLRCNSAAVVDPDAVTDCHIVAILEDLELATDRIPCVGALVVAEVRTRGSRYRRRSSTVCHRGFASVARPGR